MRKNDFSKVLSLSVIFVLIAAMALCMVSCGGKKDSKDDYVASEEATVKEELTITVTVIDNEGKSEEFIINTKSDNLGDALVMSGLVEGEDGQFGLFIKSVNGLRADYDLDGAYWSVSKGGEMLMTGASETPIADGDSFELTYTKG